MIAIPHINLKRVNNLPCFFLFISCFRLRFSSCVLCHYSHLFLFIHLCLCIVRCAFFVRFLNAYTCSLTGLASASTITSAFQCHFMSFRICVFVYFMAFNRGFHSFSGSFFLYKYIERS